MVSNNIPQVKLGIIAVSRDCFPIALSTQRRENIVKSTKVRFSTVRLQLRTRKICSRLWLK